MKQFFVLLSTLHIVVLYSSETPLAISDPIVIAHACPKKGNAKRVIVELRDFQKRYCKAHSQKFLLKQTIYAIPESGLTDYQRDEYLSILACEKKKIIRERRRRAREQGESTHIH